MVFTVPMELLVGTPGTFAAVRYSDMQTLRYGVPVAHAKMTPALIEDVKLRRAEDVAHATVDKDLAVFKAFFNWCMARNLAASNPVCRVKFFNEDNSPLRYLTEDEYSRLLQAAKKIETSPFLAEKTVADLTHCRSMRRCSQRCGRCTTNGFRTVRTPSPTRRVARPANRCRTSRTHFTRPLRLQKSGTSLA